MDLKEGNIFVDLEGGWWVGDFGSCVQHGAPITTMTVTCHPLGDRLYGTPAQWAYDWTMLAFLFVCQLDRETRHDDVARALQCVVDGVQHADLKALLMRMRDFVGPTV
jgi:hypothetical protein